MSGQRGRLGGTTARDHLMYMYPAWGGSNTPYGKGLDYLSRQEARTEDALARSQLAGLKLFALAACWSAVLVLVDGALYGARDNPVTRLLGGAGLGLVAFGRLLNGAETPSIPIAWLSLYGELIRRVLKMAIEGHVIIGILRVFGFNVFRNTYKPLAAETIVDFWNRYYYYFKELLSEFFFFPAYVRWFKQHPRLRMFVAVMAAAFAGNLYYHLLQRGALVRGDLVALWWGLNSRAFYSLLLALGIYWSMRREQARRGQPAVAVTPWVRARRILGVWSFFGVIHIWGLMSNATFGQRTRFFLSLFGL
jgi:hypothetical protein